MTTSGKEEKEMDDRRMMMRFLENKYDEYLDSLLSIYVLFNDRFGKKMSVIGGFLYFAIYREAVRCGVTGVNVTGVKQFLKHKTTDIDVFGVIEDDFSEDSFVDLINGGEMRRVLDTIGRILPLKYPRGYLIERIGKIGLDIVVVGGADEIRDEIRPRLVVRVGEDDDHIFEAMLKTKAENIDCIIYDFPSMSVPFRGEHIVSSITDQLFPRERPWNQIKNIHFKSREAILSEAKKILEEDELLMLKYRQSYYRSVVMKQIYENSEEGSLLNETMTPTNLLLSNKLFYLQSRVVNTLTPDVRIAVIEMRKKIPKNDELASRDNVVEFLNIIIDMWNINDRGIFSSSD